MAPTESLLGCLTATSEWVGVRAQLILKKEDPNSFSHFMQVIFLFCIRVRKEIRFCRSDLILVFLTALLLLQLFEDGKGRRRYRLHSLTLSFHLSGLLVSHTLQCNERAHGDKEQPGVLGPKNSSDSTLSTFNFREPDLST